jgi:1-phosphofructokinase
MIVTLTAHPSLDRTVSLHAPLRPGEVQAAASAREDAGGKGINVARVIAASGAEALAVLPLATGDPFATALSAAGIATVPVAVHGRVRANLTITDPAGVTTKLNLPGAELSQTDAASLVDAVVQAARGARWLVLAGSLPPGVADDFYVGVIDAVRSAHGADAPLIAVDTSGPALAAAVERGRPDLIKPNELELAELAGARLPDGDLPAAVAAVAGGLVPARVASALVTLGGEGAVLVTADGTWAAPAPAIRVVSTVGAGDSSLAGYLLAEESGATSDQCLRSAVRYGAAAASLPGTQAPTVADLPAGDVPVIRLSPPTP